MSLAALLLPVADAVVRLADGTPEPEDVKAGWTAFALFLLLIGAIALLGLSLTKQLRRAEAAKEAGVYGDDPVGPETNAPRGADEQQRADGQGRSAP